MAAGVGWVEWGMEVTVVLRPRELCPVPWPGPPSWSGDLGLSVILRGHMVFVSRWSFKCWLSGTPAACTPTHTHSHTRTSVVLAQLAY